MVVPTARTVAATVIARVIADKAFAAAALDAELDRAVQLEGRDRGLATELVYGSLRLYGWLEDRIERHAARGIAGLEAIVRAHLVIATYQVLILTRVPAFAAVNEAVSAIRAVRGPQVAGFANAVLRKVAAEQRPSDEEIARGALASLDRSLREAMVRAIGDDGVRALLGFERGGAALTETPNPSGLMLDGDSVLGAPGAAPQQQRGSLDGGLGGAVLNGSDDVHLVRARSLTPPLGIRIERAADRDAWIARMREARPGAMFEAGRVSPHAVLAWGAGRVVDLPGYSEGAWTPQEEGSQLVALSLGACVGEVVLDACAGRGNKTGLLARAVGAEGAVDVADVHPKKLDRLCRELERIAQQPRATFAVDWSRGVGGVTGGYDRVLIDAPCSGTGTLRRRPELGLRRSANDVGELAGLQRSILARAGSLVRPGGRVVYAVCSVLREEAEDVISAATDLEPAPFDAPAAIAIAGDTATTLRLLPHEHATDGYFIASFVRARS